MRMPAWFVYGAPILVVLMALLAYALFWWIGREFKGR